MPTRLHRWIPLAVALLAMRAANALAQGCAMCASSFEPNDPATKAFNASILFLLIAPYAASRPPKLMASPARKFHMPSLPQLSGVSGDSAGSTRCVSAAAVLTG